MSGLFVQIEMITEEKTKEMHSHDIIRGEYPSGSAGNRTEAA